MIDQSKQPRQKAGYQLEALDGELLLYHVSDTKILYLNPTASLIWQLCDGERTVGDIVAVLGDAYPEVGDALLGDVEAALAELSEQAVIELL